MILKDKILPKITIITSTYNCKTDLIKTIKSVKEQDYKNIQWIIVDGNSNDGTVEVIKNEKHIISDWISENDNGIYDAWNKACKFINGDWVIFLGAGDSFYNKNSLNYFWTNTPNNFDDYLIMYGNVLVINRDGSPRYLDRKIKLTGYEYGRRTLPNHQGVFQSNKLFENSNPFDASFKIAGDSKFMIKALLNGKAFHIDMTVSKMEDLGVSNDINNMMLANNEVKSICKEFDLKIPCYIEIINNLRIFFYRFSYWFFPNKIVVNLKKKYDFFRKNSHL